ncbi:MAG TPA: hypothetical protein DDY31_00235 [Lachnospiraceae bacterium]|nr:hypothetical protein [Lachnospiraceae bacterium]
MKIDADVIVYCAKGYGEKVCLELLSIGCRVVAFCDNARLNQGGMRLGLPVYSYQDCRMKYPKAVYVVANSTYAIAIEIGIELEKDGYVKDSSYFLAIELEMRGELSEYKRSVKKVLENQTLILFGRSFLCELFVRWIREMRWKSEVLVCPSENDIDSFCNQYSDGIWIPLEMGIALGMPEKNEHLVQILQSHGISSFTRFFEGNALYCEELAVVDRKDVNQFDVQVKKVLFLKASAMSGSSLVASVLDSHPNILSLGINIWEVNIWHIVKKAAMAAGENLAEIIIGEIKFYYQVMGMDDIGWLKDYQKVLGQYFQEGKKYSEKDVFLLIYLAYYELLHGVPLEGEAVIYLDPHANELMRDSILSWLEQMGFEIIILEMIRAPFKRLGSGIKFQLHLLKDQNKLVSPYKMFRLLHMMSGELFYKKELEYQLVRIRFEDLKMYPRQILGKLCEILGIPWSDTLLETTQAGKKSVYAINGDCITGFDLKPVYYTYDEFFDSFDKFRLDLIFREKSKAYGYSYVDKDKYPMSLEELGKLFELPFRFEQFLCFGSEHERERYHQRMRKLCTQLLYLEENKEKYAGHFQFGDYLRVEK